MTGENDNMEMVAGEQAEMLLRQLMHLKRYEVPETARMTRSRQNIMRKVREAHSNKRKTFGELLELSIPWFFAEPKYGIALLFVAFAGLQYFGVNARNASNSTGIYTSTANMAAFEANSAITTNRISYPKLPGNVPLFQDEHGRSSDIKFVGRLEE